MSAHPIPDRRKEWAELFATSYAVNGVPLRDRINASALDLVERMIASTEAA